jgi:hypothetical protein
VAEFAHGHDAGHARTALERVQVALQADQRLARIRGCAQFGEQAVRMIEQIDAFLDEDVDQFRIEAGEVERFVGIAVACLRVRKDRGDRRFRLRQRACSGQCGGSGSRFAARAFFRFAHFVGATLRLGFGGSSGFRGSGLLDGKAFGFETLFLGDALAFGTCGFFRSGAFGGKAIGLCLLGGKACGFGGLALRELFGFALLLGKALGFGVLGFETRVFGFFVCRGTFGFEALRFETLRFETLRFETLRFETLRFEALCFETLCVEAFCFETLCFEALCFQALGFQKLGFEAFCFERFGLAAFGFE